MRNQIDAYVLSELLDEIQAAKFFGVKARTLRQWRRTRALPFLKLTRKVVRFRRADLENWASRHLIQTVA